MTFDNFLNENLLYFTYIQFIYKNFWGFFGIRGHETGRNAKKNFRFLDRLPYFPLYRTIILNVKVKYELKFT